MTDRIFQNGLGGAGYESDEEDEYTQRIQKLIADSVDYEDSFLGLKRQENMEYYLGQKPALPEDANRSTIVTTDVRDTVLTVLPSLVRIFSSTSNVANFTPNTEDQVDMAAQATDYVDHVIMKDNEGFLLFYSVFKDAMTVRAGFAKWYTEDNKEVSTQHFSYITNEQIALVLNEAPGAEVVSEESQGQNEDGEEVFKVSIQYTKSAPKICVEAVPPEEIRLDRYAKTPGTLKLIGHERLVSPSYLVKQGYHRDDVAEYTSPDRMTQFTDEKFLRNEALNDATIMENGVIYGEWFIRIDGDDDGIDELREIHTVGLERIVIYDEPVDDNNFAIFSMDPRPHTVIGDDITFLTSDIQRIKTNVVRGVLDSLSESNRPKTVFNELVVNVDDVLNDEVGAVIRTRGDPNNTVAFSKVPFVGQESMPVIDYLDSVRASRTGITEASKGLDPKAMQSVALSGIDAIVSGAQERIELIARVLCETGMKRLLTGVLKETINHPNKGRMVKLRGKWTRVDPSVYDPDMRVEVNAQMGKGTDMMRLQALQQIKTDQMGIVTQWGIANPIVTPVELMNTVSDMLEIVNVKDVGRYFKPITPELLASIQNQPKEPDPALVLAQAELEKIKGQLAAKIAELNQKDDHKHMDDDFRRADAAAKYTIQAADLEAKDGARIADNAIVDAKLRGEQELSAAELALSARQHEDKTGLAVGDQALAAKKQEQDATTQNANTLLAANQQVNDAAAAKKDE